MEALTTIRPELLTISDDQVRVLMPYFIAILGGALAMITSVGRLVSTKWTTFLVTLATAGAGICSSMGLLAENPQTLFNGMMVIDRFAQTMNIVFFACMGMTALASIRYLDEERLQYPEYNVLLIFGVMGMMFLVSALDLIVLFIALEIMSLAVYVLVGFRRADRRSNEAAMKYFILGSAASAILLYGSALLYGATGSINIHTILEALQKKPELVTPMFVIGLLFVLVGFLFKIASVPFHMWMPDVYEGAPTPVTGFMTTALKAAAFATFLRVFISLGYGKALASNIQTHVHDILWVTAVLTMVVGNLVALTQTNLKRMLAYSSIAHTGYLLVGILSGHASDNGYASIVMYLISYAVMNLGAFTVLTLLSGRDDSGLNLHDLSGLSTRHPALAFAMAVFMFSMAGIPPTAGFAGKYLLLYSAVQAGEIPLVIISVLCSAVAVYYYLRVLVYMYMRDPVGATPQKRFSVWATAVVALLVGVTLHVGIMPSHLVDAAKRAVTGL